jgi:hypothetical protein
MATRKVAIIFVPGIRSKPPSAEQQEQLRRCLAKALASARASKEEAADIIDAFHVVGWSHAFYGQHSDITVDLPGIERLLSGTDNAEEDSREALSLGRRVTAFFYSLADRFPTLTSIFATRRMKTRVAEIKDYFQDADGKASGARSMLAAALGAAWANEQHVLLIGHSFGSVIAYDTFWELSRQETVAGKVDLFLSMGSPLTMRYIRRRLKGAHCSGSERYPSNIKRWLNLAAIGEVTALDRRLADRFADMRDSGLVTAISDNLSLVNQFRGPDGLNVHKCYGYMASPTVAKELLDWYRAVV